LFIGILSLLYIIQNVSTIQKKQGKVLAHFPSLILKRLSVLQFKELVLLFFSYPNKMLQHEEAVPGHIKIKYKKTRWNYN